MNSLDDFISQNEPVRYTVFFCKEQGEERKQFYSGVLYHEANHKFYGTHNNFCNLGDPYWSSVFGAHIQYLFKASENTALSCKERYSFYYDAIWHFENRLCQETEHGFSTPNCYPIPQVSLELVQIPEYN